MTGAALDRRVDFSTAGTVLIHTADELRALFVDRGPAGPSTVRLCGSASRQRELPAPIGTPTLVSTAPMRAITRFEPDDLTCSVEPGVTRDELDATLAPKRLRLPCAPAPGTIGGAFALGREAWPEAPGALGTLGSRAALLGIRGVLTDGTEFKAGAKVVKSVAGFDLHKLFVGSRGQLFAVTELHLKLRPMPRASVGFAVEDLELPRALELLRELRLDDHPPAAVRMLRRSGENAFIVSGRFEGSARVVADRIRAHSLAERSEDVRDVRATDTQERVSGLVRPSRLAGLLEMLPPRAAFVVGGTGAFEAHLDPAQSDALLPRLPELDVAAELDRTAADRRGRSTPTDRGAATIRTNLKAALDPGGILT